MKEHEHATKNKPETKLAQDDVAKKAYGIYLKEGRPQGNAEQNWLKAEAQMEHVGADHPGGHDHHEDHAQMVADFRKQVLDLTGPDHLDSLPSHRCFKLWWTAGSHSFSGRRLFPGRPFFRGLAHSAPGAVLMSASTVIVAINARLLKLKK